MTQIEPNKKYVNTNGEVFTVDAVDAVDELFVYYSNREVVEGMLKISWAEKILDTA